MCLREMPNNREPETRAALLAAAATIGSIKPLEDTREMFRKNTFAGVGNADPYSAGIGFREHG
jgi:hypothetical protein